MTWTWKESSNLNVGRVAEGSRGKGRGPRVPTEVAMDAAAVLGSVPHLAQWVTDQVLLGQNCSWDGSLAGKLPPLRGSQERKKKKRMTERRAVERGCVQVMESLESKAREFGMYLASHHRNIFFFFFFLGPNPWHLEVPRLGVESELHHKPQQRRIHNSQVAQPGAPGQS